MINTKVSLEEVEIRLCKHVAAARTKINTSMGVNDKRISSKSNLDIEIEGYGAEVAFCKLFNIFPDTSTYPRSSEDDPGDAVLHCGLSVDVKATKYSTGRLLTPIWKKDSIDVYALMVGSFPVYTFKGFMLSRDLRVESRIKSVGHGPTYAAEQGDLEGLEQIVNKIKWLSLG